MLASFRHRLVVLLTVRALLEDCIGCVRKAVGDKTRLSSWPAGKGRTEGTNNETKQDKTHSLLVKQGFESRGRSRAFQNEALAVLPTPVACLRARLITCFRQMCCLSN